MISTEIFNKMIFCSQAAWEWGPGCSRTVWSWAPSWPSWRWSTGRPSSWTRLRGTKPVGRLSTWEESRARSDLVVVCNNNDSNDCFRSADQSGTETISTWTGRSRRWETTWGRIVFTQWLTTSCPWPSIYSAGELASLSSPLSWLCPRPGQVWQQTEDGSGGGGAHHVGHPHHDQVGAPGEISQW